MPSLGARLLVYSFIGAFAIASLILLAIAVSSTAQRAMLIFSGLGADGTVTAKRQVGHLKGGAPAYAPMVSFTAVDGRTYTVTSDYSGPESAYRFGQHLRILYSPDHPDRGRVDAFAPMWTLPLVTGVVGGAFSIVPGLLVVNWIRRRRAEMGELPPGEASGTPGRGFRRALGLLLVGGGLMSASIGLISPGPGTSAEPRVLGLCMGVLLSASGVLIGQWVREGSRAQSTLGALLISAFATLFGWVSLFGKSSGFSTGVGADGATVATSSGPIVARIAFGIGALLAGLAALWAWKQVFRQRE
jgi:uncharacterized protein DUF3592